MINFPDDTIPFKEKGEGYLKQWAEAIFQYSSVYPRAYMRRSIVIQAKNNADRDSAREEWSTGWIGVNRLFAQGNQPTRNYMTKFAATKGDEGDDLSFMNIDWSIEAFAPKIVNLTASRVLDRDWFIECNPLDPDVVESGRMAYYTDRARVKNKDAIMMLRGAMGMSPELGAKGDDVDDIDNVLENGGYKPALAEAAEQEIALMLQLSDWTELLKNSLYKDLLPANALVFQCRTGADGFPRVERVPAEEVVSPWTEFDDYRDAQWFGRIRPVTFLEFCKAAAGKGGDHARLKKLFDDACTKMQGDNSRAILVEVYILDKKPLKAKVRKTPRGEEAQVVGSDYKPDLKEGSSTSAYEKNVDIVWEVMWLAQSEELVYGQECTDTPRQPNSLAKTWLPIYKVCPNIQGFDFKSFIDIIKPRLDTLQNLVLQKRNLISHIGPDAIAVYDYAINNILDGHGGTYDQHTAILQYRQGGVLVLGGIDPETNKPYYNNMMVQSLPKNEVQKISDVLMVIAQEYNGLLDMVGITPAMAATATDPDTLNGALQVQAAGTETALRWITRAVDRITELVAKDLFLRLQGSVVKGKLPPAMIEALGMERGNIIKHSADIDLASFGIMVNPGMTVEQKAEMNNMIQTQLNVRTQHRSGGITAEDAAKLRTIKNFKTFARVLGKSIRRREELDRKAAQEMQQAEIAKIQEANKGRQMEIEAQNQSKLSLMEATNGMKQQFEELKQQLSLMSDMKRTEQLKDLELRNKTVEISQQGSLEERLARLESLLARQEIAVEGEEQRKTDAAAPKPLNQSAK